MAFLRKRSISGSVVREALCGSTDAMRGIFDHDRLVLREPAAMGKQS